MRRGAWTLLLGNTLVMIGVGVALAETWVVNVFDLVDASAWATLTLELRTAGLTLFTAFVLWELLKFMTDPYSAPQAAASTATIPKASGKVLGTTWASQAGSRSGRSSCSRRPVKLARSNARPAASR